MNRRVSMLCLLVVAGAVLLAAAGAGAASVPFNLQGEWTSVYTGDGEHFPIVHVSSVSTWVDPSSTFGITRATIFFKMNALDGTISDGQLACVTPGNDVLYAHIPSGLSVPLPDGVHFDAQMSVQFVGGTGQFAGLGGSATWTSTQTVVVSFPPGMPRVVIVEGGVTGTLTLADLDQKMVPDTHWDGWPVPGSLVVEPEAIIPPLGSFWYFQSSEDVGLGTHAGRFVAAHRMWFNIGPWFVDPYATVPTWGFDVDTLANGDVREGYTEGMMTPSTTILGAYVYSFEHWTVCGTGSAANASGYRSGGGLIYPDGSLDLNSDGVISSVGSSKP